MTAPVLADFLFSISEVHRGSSNIPITAGRGHVTNVPIPCGALILSEYPWFRLLLGDYAVPEQYTRDPAWATLQTSPAPGITSNHGDNYLKFLLNALRCGVYRPPGLDRQGPALGIFVRAAGFNASCRPNVHAHWVLATPGTPDHMEFRALRDITPREELVISYNTDMLLYPTPQRIQRLQATFGFLCQCSACTFSDLESDRRRANLGVIVRGGVANIERIQEALSYLTMEGLYHYRDTLHYDLYHARVRAGDNNAMLSYWDARDYVQLLVGPGDPRVQEMNNNPPP